MKLNFQYLNFIAGQEYYLMGETELAKKYLERAASHYRTLETRTTGRIYYLLGEMEKAKAVFENLVAENRTEKRNIGHLGVINAKLNLNVKAYESIGLLEDLKALFDYGECDYQIAKIQLALGEDDAALIHLRAAIKEGKVFGSFNTFNDDPDLIPLFNNPKYKALINVLGED